MQPVKLVAAATLLTCSREIDEAKNIINLVCKFMDIDMEIKKCVGSEDLFELLSNWNSL